VTWQSIQEPLFPWARTIDRIISASRPPELKGATAVVATDYSGAHSESDYSVVTALWSDLEGLARWQEWRRVFRKQLLPDGRRFSFKALTDRQRQRAILPFMESALTIEGVCVALLIRKSLRSICLPIEHHERLKVTAGLTGRWKARSLEQVLRVVHLIALLAGGLSKPGQNIYWISDQDDILANAVKSKDTALLLSKVSSHYVRHPLGELGVGTTALDEGDRFEEDLAAIPDLVSGALSETATSLSRMSGGRISPFLAVPFDGTLTNKADLITRWLWLAPGVLRRSVVLFENQDGNQYSVSRLEMKDPEYHA
jgi:hypothetical protein